MFRRFVYMVDVGGRRSSHSYRLRRFNPSSLFYPNGALPPEPDRAAAEVEDARLPPTTMSFCSPGIPGTFGWMLLMRRNDDKIVGVDQTGRATLYDAVEHTIRTLPTMITPKVWNMSLAVGDDLYVMEMTPCPDKDGGSEGWPQRSFEALVHCKKPQGKEEDDCFWRPLPPPPCVHATSYHTMIFGYAVVGDSHILVSTTSHGTYAFDTARSAWSKAGDWMLPFRGHAVYVPMHGLWFGFSATDDNILGAWDLSSSPFHQQQQPPVASLQSNGFSVPSRGDWKGLAVPEVFDSHVVYLGAGKLCVVKQFKVFERRHYFAMLTGVEVVRGRGRKLRIIKHKSYRYSFGEDNTPGCRFIG